MSAILLRTSRGMSTQVSVEISPATTTSPVVISVSQATRPAGSSASTASSNGSEIWSAILSGWPSVTDSDVNRNSRAGMKPGRLVDRQEGRQLQILGLAAGLEEQRAERLEVALHLGRDGFAGHGREALDQRDQP